MLHLISRPLMQKSMALMAKIMVHNLLVMHLHHIQTIKLLKIVGIA